MTVSEAHIAFKIEADKNAVNIGMSGCPSFLPEEIDYSLINSLRTEAVQKLTDIKPESVGQAARISGVSPADISVLLVYLENYKK